MLLRVLLVGSDQHDQQIRDSFRWHPMHSVATLGRVCHSVAALCMERFVPDVVIVDCDDDAGELIRMWNEFANERVALICISKDVHYALDAFRAGAAHYLVTPTSEEMSHIALSRAAAKLHAYDLEQMNSGLWPITVPPAHATKAPYHCKVIALPNSSSIQVRNSHELMSAHSEGSYTRVVLREEPPVILSRPLGDLEPELKGVGLMRIHRSHMVNVDQIRTVRRGKQPIVQLANGAEFDVGESYKQRLFDILNITRPPKK